MVVVVVVDRVGRVGAKKVGGGAAMGGRGEYGSNRVGRRHEGIGWSKAGWLYGKDKEEAG